MNSTFDLFLRAFPHQNQSGCGAEAEFLAAEIPRRFGVEVPEIIVELWSHLGSGYFADGELYVFGALAPAHRESVVTWNISDFWRRIFPAPTNGGPVFFAETCFGTQIGFRWEKGTAVGCALDVDALELFRLSNSLDELFSCVLADRYALTDPELLRGVVDRLGPLPEGMHYAPIVSPLVGGALAVSNYEIETRNVHLRTSIATWEAIGASANDPESRG